MAVPDIPYTLNMKKVESAVTNIVNGRPVMNRDALKNRSAWIITKRSFRNSRNREALARVTCSVIPAKAGIQNSLEGFEGRGGSRTAPTWKKAIMIFQLK